MFFKIELKHTIQIEPNNLDGNIETFITKNVEQKTGYNKEYQCIVIMATRVVNFKPLRIAEITGNVIVEVIYEAIVQKFAEDEVVDAVVTKVTKDYVVCKVGVWEDINIGSFNIEGLQYNESKNAYVDVEGGLDNDITPGKLIKIKIYSVGFNVNGYVCFYFYYYYIIVI